MDAWWALIQCQYEGTPLTVPVDCLQSLNSAEARIRLKEVRKAHPATFDWLFDGQKVPFITWLHESDPGDYRPFWIHGKPGSGKSTLMKFAIRNPQTLRALSGSRREKWTFSSYFFHDRGSSVQKTLPAMLQELLYWILVDNIALVQYVLPIYLTLRAEQKTRRIKWDLANLRAAIINVLGSSTCKVNLCLFLDALDEHHGENEELVKLLWDMADTARNNPKLMRFKICLASRPWPIFEKSFRKCPQFAIDEHTQGDIKTYTAQRIRNAMYTPQQVPAEAAIVESIVRRAWGVFIWVRLVLDRITQDIIDGTPFLRLQQTIAHLPSELGDLYRFTVQRVKPQYHPETWLMFQAVLCALRPLPLVELVSITNTHSMMDLVGIADKQTLPSVETDGAESDKVLDSVPEAINSVIEEQRRWLNSRSGGLLEVDDVAEPERCFVQFIHQTVKDSLIHHGLGLGFNVEHDEIDTSNYQSTGYEILLKACHRSLPSIWTDALVYAKLAESSTHGQQERLKAVSTSTLRVLEQLDEHDIALNFDSTAIKDWMRSYSVLSREQGFRPLLLAIAANLRLFLEVHLTNVEREFLDREPHVREAGNGVPAMRFYGQADFDRLGPHLLNFAAVGPIVKSSGVYEVQRANMVEMLLGHGCNCNKTCDLPGELGSITVWGPLDDFGVVIDAPTSPLATLCIIHRELERESQSVFDIAKALIKHGASVDTGGHFFFKGAGNAYLSILEYSVRYGSAEWVRFILSHGATKTTTESEDFLTGCRYKLADLAYLRHDADIIGALEDHGLYDLRHRVSDEVAESSTCSRGIRMVGKMLTSTMGGVGSDLGAKVTEEALHKKYFSL
ncbi:MAG: hypothetical protein Q9184_003411 [Pyrenodesmia sp. 2 TL-2023]